ncbi:MAG TPA: sialidase family protein [Thermoanaerobaculia bacterium]|nr:sialidase family protein [Thermoanaerobaculia bacterium]
MSGPVVLGPRANRRVSCSTLPNDRSESVLVANPANPYHMVGASKRFTDPANYVFDLATYATFDGGLSWSEARPKPQDGWGLLSDPVIAWDDAGNVYLVSLPLVKADDFVGIAVYKSTDGGRTWGAPDVVFKGKADKPWAMGDTNPASPHHGNVYAVWLKLSESEEDEAGAVTIVVPAELRFARTLDHGASWKGTGSRSAGSSLFTAAAAKGFRSPELTVAADGTVYIVWFDDLQPSILFTRSTDGGATFSPPAEVAAQVKEPPEILPGASFRAEIAPTACTAGASLVVFAWTDQTPGTSRVYYRRSTDGGATWLGSSAGDPLLAGAAASGAGRQEFFPQIVALPSGEIGCAFYEMGPKGTAGKNLIDVVLAVSTDQGATFPQRATITDRPWDPTVAEVIRTASPRVTFIGDYFGLEATRLGFFPFWTDTRTGVQEIFTARVAVNPADLYLRDSAADTGDPAAVPSPDAAWDPPDLVVRRQPDGETTFANQDLLADGKTDHFVYGRVTNRGANAAVNAQLSAVVAAYPSLSGLPGAEFRYPQDWYAGDWGTPSQRAYHLDLGLSPPKSVAVGATEILGPVKWPAADLRPRFPFPCLLAEVRADNDDSGGGADGGDLRADPNPCGAGAFFWGNNNACQRNLRYAASAGLLIRDAVDDDGTAGAVAWGGRSPDIVVTQTPVQPEAAFVDLDDPAPGELLAAGENRIFVRVFNRGAARVSAAVDLYFAPAGEPWTWSDPAHRIAAAVPVADVDPGTFKFTAEIPWTPQAGPPGYLLVALARPATDPLPPLPSPAEPQDLESFWTWFGTGAGGSGAALRAVRFKS